MYKRKALCLIIVILVFLPFNIGAYADDDIGEESQKPSISIQMTYINNISNDFTISAGQAYIACSVKGYNDITDKVAIYVNLQQYKDGSWVTIKSWSETFNDYIGNINKTYSVDKGYTYRVRASFTAYSGEKSESISSTSNTVKY
ncbi:hypothetical protein [Proteiniborus sp. MB09-C3]|uniref:hypothetical protein n=1 Tax=Proteiniborus sp. MB09-C3 TaxID=3050072 RepID=UPI0025540F0E|nr:hypothetical protein [Proteiniborus sp. MB09-C3]WIV13507.1 hypothetical protein QO263_07315 [Proteiniborus sp. MB09-C3]